MEPVRHNNIKALTDVYLESLLEDMPSEEEIASQQVLSRGFLRRMDRLMQKEHRTPRAWKKMLLIAAIICTILATAVSVYANREAIYDFIIHIYEEFSEIIFQKPSETPGSSSETNTGNSLTENMPENIPAGYRESARMTLIGLIQITYTNDAGDILLFEKVEKSGVHIGINTEGVKTEELEIIGYKGLYYSNLGQNNLLWTDGTYAYTIIGIITKQEAIDLAISTN